LLVLQAEARILVSVYVSMSRLRVAPGRAQEVVCAFRGRAHLVDEAPGFLKLEVWRNDRDEGELVMVSHWTDRECFKSYMKSEAHRLSHDRIDPELDAEIRLEALEHMHTYDVVAE
jgi:heme oxygenase (mycobilin-producing)